MLTSSPISTRSAVDVQLIDSMGSEESIVRAARVSTLGSKAEAAEAKGLLRYLWSNGHASPFEHVTMTFRVEAPIFVTREMLRHRISSFNEESGRYRALEGVFYLPSEERPLVQVGKVGNYDFVPGSSTQQFAAIKFLTDSYDTTWKNYQQMLALGISREVARMGLPVGIYSTIFYTANLRSVLNFISQRVNWGEEATYQSKPQFEIELVALKIAAEVASMYPTVWELFKANGYVAV